VESLAVLKVWFASCLVLTLRLAPMFTFAPPFNLTRTPRLFNLLLGFGLAIGLVSSGTARMLPDSNLQTLVPAAAGELMMGAWFVLLMQLCFAALSFAGRLLDIQAGFGLATLIDPVSRAQSPLIGTMFTYAAGALFFSTGGHLEMLRIVAASLKAAPLDSWGRPAALEQLLGFMSSLFVASMGVAGAAVLALFLLDAAIALLARTVPQMNVLVLGFQVKTLALLLVLPACFGLGGAVMLRMIRITLDAMSGAF